MPLHVPTSSSGAFVLLEGVGDDEDDDGDEDDDDDDDGDEGPASPRAPPNAKRVLRHYRGLG